MEKRFCEDIYNGYLIKGDLAGAIRYVGQFPEQAKLYHKFQDVFEKEQYAIYEADAYLNGILAIYRQYYRNAFYLCIGKEQAADALRAGLAEFFGITGEMELCDLEQLAAEAFQNSGFHFLGGRTSGYYGPYIWKTTDTKTYQVELPDGIQEYTVKLLDDFISKSWVDYISFGRLSTGGWADKDGIINCVKASYDFESENFLVSLLKHEAQHAKDLSVYQDMSSEDLEYRAKLVELIYSRERNLLGQFVREADASDGSNGHSAASGRIIRDYAKILGKDGMEFASLPAGQIQNIARQLYEESGRILSSGRQQKA